MNNLIRSCTMQALLNKLRQDEIELERLVLYALLHHDHHFLTEWGIEEPWALLSFDSVRRKVETEFDDLYRYLHNNKIRSFYKDKIITIARYLGKEGAHSWAQELAKSPYF